jgi:hypothetical protein
MNLPRQIDSVSKICEDSTQRTNPSKDSGQDKDSFDVHQQRLEQAVAGLKAAASSSSVDKGAPSAVSTAPPLTYIRDVPLRATRTAASLQAEYDKPAKTHKTLRLFVALALFLTGYVAALFSDSAAPELITKFGVRAIYGEPREASPTLDELAALRRDLEVAREEISIAKDKEAGWMRAFEEDDTKAVALSRELEAVRKQITGHVATVSALRSEVSETKDARAAAEAKVQALTLALGIERDKVVSLTRNRGGLIARSVSGAAARSEFLQERPTAEVTESEWKQRLDNAIQELDRLRNVAPTGAQSRQAPASVPAAPGFQLANQPDPAATWALSSESRDGMATPRLANRPALTGRTDAAEDFAPEEATLLARAEYFLDQADIAGARRFLERALEKGSARAALMLAQTYDAELLQSLHTVGVRPDTDKARQFYQVAAAAGIEQAQERLRALDSIERR